MSSKYNTIKKSSAHRSDRYRLAKATAPANGFPLPPLNARTAVVAIRDPDPHERRPSQALSRIDALEDELQHDRIDDAQYAAGKRLIRAWEDVARIKQSSVWRVTGRVDGGTRDAEIAMLERAAAARVTLATARAAIGETGVRLLRAVLIEGRQLGEFAKAPTAHARSQVGAIFRWHLASLADAWAARGPDNARGRSSR